MTSQSLIPPCPSGDVFLSQNIINNLTRKRKEAVENIGSNKVVQGINNSISNLNLKMETSAKSYLDIDNVQKSNIQAISPSLLEEVGDYIYLDMNLAALNPPQEYIKLLKSIGINKEDCLAEIEGFTVRERESGNKTIYPVIQGGAYNPYKKYKSNRSSASRRLKNVDIFLKLLNANRKGKSVNMLNLNLTFPKEISDYLFNLPPKEDDKICREVLKEYMEKVFGKGVGYYSNLHKWGSRDPFNPHYHFHIVFFNYEKTLTGFKRLNAKVPKDTLNNWRKDWFDIICLKFPNDFKSEKVNIWYQYFKNYGELEKENLEQNKKNRKARCDILHLLKYCTRSYLYDVFNYFSYNDSDKDKNYFKLNWSRYKKMFKGFCDRGCIQNRTTIHGFLHNIKFYVRKADTPQNNLYYNCYLDMENRTTFRDPIKQEIERKPQNSFVEKLFLEKDLDVFVSYKSKVIKICTFRVKDKRLKPLSKNQKQLGVYGK